MKTKTIVTALLAVAAGLTLSLSSCTAAEHTDTAVKTVAQSPIPIQARVSTTCTDGVSTYSVETRGSSNHTVQIEVFGLTGLPLVAGSPLPQPDVTTTTAGLTGLLPPSRPLQLIISGISAGNHGQVGMPLWDACSGHPGPLAGIWQ